MHDVEVPGLTMPALGFGTWQLRGEACQTAVEHALSIGYRLVDTAAAYENESEVGAAIAASSVPRDEIVVSTKLPYDCVGTQVRAGTEERLRLLGLDELDLLLIHWPREDSTTSGSDRRAAGADRRAVGANDDAARDNSDAGGTERDANQPGDDRSSSSDRRSVDTDAVTLEEMASLQDEGLVRAIGVCNFPPSRLDAVVGVARLAAHQFEYHPFLGQATLLERSARYDHAVMAYSPVARGRAATDPVLAEIGAGHGKSGAQVALRWLVQQDRVTAVPKAASPERRVENLDVFDFALSTEEMDRIAALDDGYRTVDPDWGPDWEDGRE